MSVETYDFSVHYDGEALKNNSIPIRDLAPSLLALSESFQEAQSIIDPNQETVSLEIKATEKGSFQVVLQAVLDTTLSFLNSSPVVATGTLVTIVEGVNGAFKFIKYYKNVSKIETGSETGKTKIILDNDTSFEINDSSLKIAKDLEFRKSVKEFIEPINRDGISSIGFIHKKETVVTIEKNNVSAFEVPPVEEEDLKTNTTEEYVQLKNVAFENGKWKFSMGDTCFFAKIEDEDFLKSVAKNDEQFGSTDLLKVELQTRQFIDKSGNLKQEFTILKVLEHKKGAQQIKFDI